MVKLKIGAVNKQRNSHSYRCTNSTSANFSYVQPLICRMMLPSSEIKGKASQFVRCSAMPLPTFGDLRLRNAAVFVPVDDVFPNFAALMSQKSVMDLAQNSEYIPRFVTRTSNSGLMYMLLNDMFLSATKAYTLPLNAPKPPTVESAKPKFSSVDVESKPSPKDLKLMPFPEYRARYSEAIMNDKLDEVRLGGMTVYDARTANLVKAVENGKMTEKEASIAYAANTSPSFIEDEAQYDYITVNFSGNLQTSSAICYRFNERGRALRKILLGLGYNPSLDDSTTVSLLPLLAFYKAYYDRFVPFRSKPWASTRCYQLIMYLQNRPSLSGNLSFDPHPATITANQDENDLFSLWVIEELSQCFSTRDVDYITLHYSELGAENTPYTMPTWLPNEPKASGTPTQTLRSSVEQGPYLKADSVDARGGVLNAVSLTMLQKLYGYFNRDTVLGNRIDLWMKSHLDSDIYNEYFRRTHPCAENDIPITISDIDSLANTLQGSGAEQTGSALGVVSGKGVGSGDALSFKCESKTYGYFIILSWIDPVTNYWQGTDPELFATDKWAMPQKEFDALGYEATPRSVFWTDDGISLRNDTDPWNKEDAKTISDKDGFGFVPRYSGFKQCKNIVNGDFSLRSQQKSLAPYYLDRTVQHRYFEKFDNTEHPGQIKVVANTLPVASDEWRYTEKYDFLGNYNRIFYNENALTTDDGTTLARDDNFYIHTLFDFTENTPLKPLSISFDTDVRKDDDSMTVTPS